MKFLVTCWKTPRKRWEEKPPVHCIIEAGSRGSAIIDIKMIEVRKGMPREELDKLNWVAEPMQEILNYGSLEEYKYLEIVRNEQKNEKEV